MTTALLQTLPPLAVRIMEAVKPHEVRVVGGWVRTYLRMVAGHGHGVGGISLERTECDLATTATPDEMEPLLLAAGLRVTDAGRRWGTLTVHGEPEEMAIEVTSLRQDQYVAGSRYPAVAWTTDWSVDAARRDFTVNAVYLAADGNVYDPYGGQDDLMAGVIRFIGDPQQRMAEDPLRWLRFWRFCSQYGMAGVTPEILETMVAAVPGLASLSRSRVQAEWDKLQRGVWAGAVLDIWRKEGVLPMVQARLETAA